MQEEGLSKEDIRAWIKKANLNVSSKDRVHIVELIEWSNIKMYVSSIQGLSIMLRANLSIVRSNLKLCKDAYQYFLKPAGSKNANAPPKPQVRITRFKPS